MRAEIKGDEKELIDLEWPSLVLSLGYILSSISAFLDEQKSKYSMHNVDNDSVYTGVVYAYYYLPYVLYNHEIPINIWTSGNCSVPSLMML